MHPLERGRARGELLALRRDAYHHRGRRERAIRGTLVPAEAGVEPARKRAVTAACRLPLLRRDLVERVPRAGVVDVDAEPAVAITA